MFRMDSNVWTVRSKTLNGLMYVKRSIKARNNKILREKLEELQEGEERSNLKTKREVLIERIETLNKESRKLELAVNKALEEI